MKQYKLGAVLFTAALLFATQVYAESAQAPAPKKSPPRVPFTAFRTKPILELKTRTEGDAASLVVQDIPKKKERSITFKVRPSDNIGTERIRPIPGAKPDTESVQENILFTPGSAKKLAAPARRDDDEPVVQFVSPDNVMPGGLVVAPVPPRKPDAPAQAAEGGVPGLIERILASPAENQQDTPSEQQPRMPDQAQPLPETTPNYTVRNGAVVPSPAPSKPLSAAGLLPAGVLEGVSGMPAPQPQPGGLAAQNRDLPETAAQQPQMQGQAQPAYQQPERDAGPDVSSVRIRDANRFSGQQRMGGSNIDLGGARSIRSLGLPKDMQNLRLGRLEEGDGVSPVLMPGQKVTMAAPDGKQVDKRGVPNEVIVFFQEESADMEVGQMDVLNNDVVAMLKNRPDLELEIRGYAEPQSKGADETKKMALARALMVQQYLVRQKISADRLRVEGKGANTDIEPRDRVEMYFER